MPPPDADAACLKVRSGIGDQWACRAHGRPWPCSVRDQPAEQLAMLHRASPLAPPILLEVAAERLHQLALHPPDLDDRKGGLEWVELLVDYLNRASDEGRRVQEAVRRGEAVAAGVAAWRRRLVQVAAIATAAVESCDRVVAPMTERETP